MFIIFKVLTGKIILALVILRVRVNNFGYKERNCVPFRVAANVTDQTFTCVYCGDKVAVGNTRHELYECGAANQIYDPGPNESYAAITPMARRAAALTHIRLLDEHSSGR